MHRAFPFIALLAVLSGLVLWRLAALRKPSPTNAPVLRAVATFYPLAEFARNVGGTLVEVRMLVPAGAEPHDYEPTPQDIVAAHESAVALMNGAVDAWFDRIVPDLRAARVRVVRVQDAIPGVADDPHVWLDPGRAGLIVGMIRDAFADADPDHAETYKANAAAYLSKLEALDRDYRVGLAQCASRMVVVSHDAIGYLAERYGLEELPIAGLSPDEEPSPRRLQEIAAQAKAAAAKTIFFETLVSPKLAETIAREIGASTAVLDPIEGLTPGDSAAGKDYLDIMRRNLDTLRNALSCR